MQGKIQYGSALYWLRADRECIDRVRFYYAMAMAACMGLEAPEVVGMQNCRNNRRRLSASSEKFLALCEFLNMPTLKDLAIQNASTLIRQWSIFEPRDSKN